jgi:hypothetical protein
MRSVVDDIRDEDRRALLGLTAAARVRLALELGDRGLDTFRLAHDPPLDRAAAARVLEQRRQASRRACRCLEEIIG